MRIFTIILTVLIFQIRIPAQTNIKLIVKTDKHIDKVDIFDLSQQEVFSSIYKDTINFLFKKENIDCYNIRYHEKDKIYQQQIWLDTGSIVLKAAIAADKLVIDTVFNSPAFYYTQNFFKTYSELIKTKDSVIINNFLLQQYEANLKNPFSFLIGDNYLLRNQNSRANLINLKSLLDRQGDKFSWFILYPSLVDRMNKLLITDKVNISDFTFFDTQNKKSEPRLTGANYYILDFWFLGCAPCLEDHKEIKPNIKKLQEQGIAIISISTDVPGKFKTWQSYLSKNGYNWPNYLEDSSNSVTKYLVISAYPTYLVLNKEKKIIGTYNVFADILKKYVMD